MCRARLSCRWEYFDQVSPDSIPAMYHNQPVGRTATGALLLHTHTHCSNVVAHLVHSNVHTSCNAVYNCTHLRCSVALCRGGCTSYRIAVFTKPHCGKVYSVEHMTGITPPARHETQTHTNINTKSFQLNMLDFVFSKVICTLSLLMIFIVIFGI